MERLLSSLRAAAEPTRLRLLALAARGSFCVMEFTEILGQSQPRLSRHLKLLCDCGLLDRVREGANVWFTLPQGDDGTLAHDLIARLPTDDTILESEFVLLLAFLDRHADERVKLAANYLRAKQLPGGGWANYPGGPAEVSVSVKAYLALKIAGDAADEPHMARAAAAVRALGGAENTNSFTRFYLALLGQLPYSACPSVPAETGSAGRLRTTAARRSPQVRCQAAAYRAGRTPRARHTSRNRAS